MKKLLLAGVAFTALIAGPAMAADLPVRAPVYRAPPAPVVILYNWTGCYIGGHVGGLWAKKDWTLTTPGDVAFGAPLGSHDANSWLGGVQAGCNYQFAGGWVVGIQGDYAWTDAKGSHVDLVDPTVTDNTRIRSLASVTGRVGYAWDRFLGYVKGGGAWEKDDYTGIVAGTVFDTASETRSGWTIGIGGEYAFTNNLTGFIEYNYYDFGTRTLTFLTPAGAFNDNIDIKETKSVLKVGLNWMFGGKSPVLAKY